MSRSIYPYAAMDEQDLDGDVEPEQIRMEQVLTAVAGPPKPFIMKKRDFSPLLLRQLFLRLERHEGNKKDVPVVLFRRCFQRLLDMFDPQMGYDVQVFGHSVGAEGGFRMKWADVRKVIDEGAVPSITLSFPEMVFMTLEDFTSSWLALVWYILTNAAIVTNVAVLILKSLDQVQGKGDGDSDAEESTGFYHWLMQWCVNLFIFDYLTKAVCVFWTPIAHFDEAWALDRVLPTGSQGHLAGTSLHTTGAQRFWYWASTASNIVDFLSILPNLLNVAFSGMHLPLSSLRMLRLLRVIRVLRAFKAVGKWVVTLQVMGEAFAASMGTIMVLILYIVLFSLVVGAVLNQQSPDTEAYATVPLAMRTVAEVFLGKSFSVTESIFIGTLLAALGLAKGIIFLLPIERMKKATKISEDKFEEVANLKAQVEQEASMAQHKKHLWARDFRCPSVRVEIWDSCHPSGKKLPTIGTLHIPILESKPLKASVIVPLHHGSANTWIGGRAEIELLVVWEPNAENTERLPKGRLQLQIIRGMNFSGSAGARWIVRFIVPQALYGPEANASWESPPSESGAKTPLWNADASRWFDINWKAIEEMSRPNMPSPSSIAKIDETALFQERVLLLLEEQSESLRAQTKLIEEQSRRIDEQSGRISKQAQQIEELERSLKNVTGKRR